MGNCDGCSYDYVYSMGPDGTSRSFGHDPDDLTAMSNRSTWFAAVHPIGSVETVLLLLLGAAVGLSLNRPCKSTRSD